MLEMGRRCRQAGLQSQFYTSNRCVPTPLAQVHTLARFINFHKLNDIGFMPQMPKIEADKSAKLLKVPEEHTIKLPGLVRPLEKKDIT